LAEGWEQFDVWSESWEYVETVRDAALLPSSPTEHGIAYRLKLEAGRWRYYIVEYSDPVKADVITARFYLTNVPDVEDNTVWISVVDGSGGISMASASTTVPLGEWAQIVLDLRDKYDPNGKLLNERGLFVQVIYSLKGRARLESDTVLVRLDEVAIYRSTGDISTLILPTPLPTDTTGLEPPMDAALGDVWVRPVDEMAMVYVQGGTFMMGSNKERDPNADDDELPQHAVTLDSFWMDQTEVTNQQFSQFLNELGNRTEGDVNWINLGDPKGAIKCIAGTCRPKPEYVEHPVSMVSWHGAAAYCEWVGGRLPTEAEWEYAARGTEGRVYPWGDEFTCDGGNMRDEYTGCQDGYENTAPVGQFPNGASWCGALDMAGNVWEWCLDWRGEYTREKKLNPLGMLTGESKVVRGSWCSRVLKDGRTAHRDSRMPATRESFIGFRCVRPIGK
jgi:formylglycine-generating enzyme required for sulfatase activity